MTGPIAALVVAEQLRRRVPGGIGTYTAGLLDALGRERDRGVEVTLYASASRARPDPLERFGFALERAHLPAKALVPAWDAGLVRAPRGFDLVHHVSLSGPAAAVPIVTTVYDLAWRRVPEAFPPRGIRWHEAALRRARRRGAHFVVPSVETRDELLADGVAPDDTTVIAGAADHLATEDRPAARALLDRIGVRGPYLLSVGSIEPRKNLGRLLEAFAACRGELDGRPDLVLVGPAAWGPSISGPPEGARLAGAVTPGVLSALYHGARALCYVPLLEGFGLPVLEAMRAGTPVLSSSVPTAAGATERCDPYDVDSIAAALVRVVNDDERRAELVAAGLAHEAGYSWQRCASAHLELWRTLVGR